MKRLLGLVVLLGLAPAARAAEPSALDLWPVLVRDSRPVAGLRVTRAGGPFFERWEADGGETGWTLRPLVARLSFEDRSDLEFLYPLGGLHRSPERNRLRITPFVDRSTVHDTPSQDDDRGFTLGPIFAGRASDGGRYGGFFPFGGVLRERFGLERAEFWLFPLFARTTAPSGFRRTWLLWPFFSWGSGGDRELLKIWPLFGKDVRAGEFERHYALWPFVHWRRERIGSGGEARVRLFLPFYGESVSAHGSSRLVLGNLFLRSVNHSTGARSTDVLWPLFRVASWREDGKDFRELRFEPLFSNTWGPGLRRTSALLGLVHSFSRREETLTRSAFRVLFVTRFDRLFDPVTGEKRVRRHVWPLFRWDEKKAVEGPLEEGLLVPWLLPLGGSQWERHVLGLTTLFHYRRRDDEARSDWLWSFARSREASDYRLDAISWLYRRERHADQTQLHLLSLPIPR